MFRLWLNERAEMSEMSGGFTSEHLSIDEVADMCDALDAWQEAEARANQRKGDREEDEDD